MPTFYMTIGCSGAGKTTWVMNQPNMYPRIILDSDAIREELYGNWADQSHNAQIFDEMYQRTIEAMKRENDIYYVATNLSMKRRIQLLERLCKMFPQYNYECRVFVRTPETLHKQNNGREHKVPDYVIDRQLRQFQLPVKNEGWDIISYDIEKTSVEYCLDILKRIEEFGSQDNPHHTLTLSEHLDACFDLITLIADGNSANTFDLMQAADLHDVGKLFTKSYDEENIAHYFGHENFGAQIALLFGIKPYVAQLINYHMVPYDYKALTTWKKRFGDDMWNDLLLLHQADEGAH